MRTIIVDDDPVARKIMETLCAGTNMIDLKGSFCSSMEAIGYLNTSPVDLAFIDIEMPDMSGIDLIKTLKEKPLTVFTTAKEQYALEAFDLEVVDYLVKPITLPRFMKAVLKAKEKLRPLEVEHGTVFIKSEGIYVNLNLSDITCIEAQGDYITINIQNSTKRYTIYETLTKFEKKLNQNFIRVHRSHIINKAFIQSIEDNTLVVDKKLIPIGVSYREQVYKALKLS
jgi:two-component system, LytTR family, response regulator LytT